MKQKIICSECETLLEPGEDPPVFKKCIKCVIETTPGADLSKIVDSGRRTFESQRPKPNPKKRPAVKQAFDNFYRGDAKYPTPIALLLWQIMRKETLSISDWISIRLKIFTIRCAK